MLTLVNNNNYFNELEEIERFKKLDKQIRHNEANQKYYLKNKEQIIKKKMEYSKTYEKFNNNNNVIRRYNYYVKKGYFQEIRREKGLIIIKYMIENKLKINHINYCIELFNFLEILK